jgi:YihY family inner membrane protein
MFKELLSTPTTQLGKAGRLAVFQIKLWSHCARLLKVNRAGQQAAALSYHTIFGIVPLAIVILLIFQLFPTHKNIADRIKTLVYEQLHLTTIEYHPDPEKPDEKIMLTEYLDSIIGDFFKGVNTGSITIISAVFVIWAALALLSTIERAFNNIWHVPRGRNLLHRVINYWAVLTLGPLFLGVGIYVITQYTAAVQIEKTILSSIGPALLSYLVSTAGFFLLYFILPNTKVQARAAISSAAVAALVWAIAKWGFGLCVVRFVPYGKVYGVLGLIPLSILWIFITWLIVLFGLQLTFTTQHLKSLDAAQISAARKTERYFIASDLTVINIVREIATAFERNSAPVAAEVICSKLSIPAEFGEKILDHLVTEGLLVKTSDPVVGFLPATDPENVKLSQISKAVANASFGQPPHEAGKALEHIADEQNELLRRYNLKQILTDEQDAASK